jgi:hypothetical protein
VRQNPPTERRVEQGDLGAERALQVTLTGYRTPVDTSTYQSFVELLCTMDNLVELNLDLHNKEGTCETLRAVLMKAKLLLPHMTTIDPAGVPNAAFILQASTEHLESTST